MSFLDLIQGDLVFRPSMDAFLWAAAFDATLTCYAHHLPLVELR